MNLEILVPKNIGTHATKVAENMSHKSSLILLNSAKKFTTHAIKTASKRTVGNKIADEITSISKSPQNENER